VKDVQLTLFDEITSLDVAPEHRIHALNQSHLRVPLHRGSCDEIQNVADF
jgi:hypothetical protein